MGILKADECVIGDIFKTTINEWAMAASHPEHVLLVFYNFPEAFNLAASETLHQSNDAGNVPSVSVLTDPDYPTTEVLVHPEVAEIDGCRAVGIHNAPAPTHAYRR